MQAAAKKIPRTTLAVVVVAAFVVMFFLPVFGTSLSPSVWYPYKQSPSGYGSVTYELLGYGAVFWSPNHYWLFFGSSVLQVTNSSASTISVTSIDQNGSTIFGYYTIISDAQGKVMGTGYTKVSFPTNAGEQYTVQMEGYGKCVFDHWSNGVTSSEQVVVAKSGDEPLTAVYTC